MPCCPGSKGTGPGRRTAGRSPHAEELAQHRAQRQQADRHGVQRDAVIEIDDAEGHALGAVLRIEADRRQKDAQGRRGKALGERVAGQPRDEGEGEDDDGGDLRRTEQKGDRGERRRQRDENGIAGAVAEHGGIQRHAHGLHRLAAFRERVAVSGGCDVLRAARRVEQDRRDGAAGRAALGDGDQERQRAHRLHVERDRNQDRDRGQAADTRQYAHDDPDDDADDDESEIGQRECGLEAGSELKRNLFHSAVLPEQPERRHLDGQAPPENLCERKGKPDAERSHEPPVPDTAEPEAGRESQRGRHDEAGRRKQTDVDPCADQQGNRVDGFFRSEPLLVVVFVVFGDRGQPASSANQDLETQDKGKNREGAGGDVRHEAGAQALVKSRRDGNMTRDEESQGEHPEQRQYGRSGQVERRQVRLVVLVAYRSVLPAWQGLPPPRLVAKQRLEGVVQVIHVAGQFLAADRQRGSLQAFFDDRQEVGITSTPRARPLRAWRRHRRERRPVS